MVKRGAEVRTPRSSRFALRASATLIMIVGLASVFLAQAPGANAESGRVVIIGVPGLAWSDIGEKRTPHLWGLTGQGAAGALSIRATRSNTCPTDGWLTLSAGQRARLAGGDCVLPSAPVGVPAAGAATAPGWGAIRADNEGGDYHAKVGLLGQAVRGATLAVGPGAVFGLADRYGKVARYAPSPDKVAAGDWSRYRLAAVDIDDVFRAHVATGVDAEGAQKPLDTAKRAAAAAAADRRVGQVLAAVPAGTTVLVAGLADNGLIPHLRVAIAKGPGFKPGYLSSSATRQPGMVTLTDLTATTLKVLGLHQPKDAVGSVWKDEPTGPVDETGTLDKVEALEDDDVAAQARRRIAGSFFWVLGGVQLAVYGLAALALRRRWKGPSARGRILVGTRLIALLGAGAPIATFLAGLVPWWRTDHPVPALIAAVTAFSAVLVALAVAGSWRRSVTMPGLIVAAATAAVLALDVMTGSRLQMEALMGHTALVAGRFYGFGNQAFALFAVAAILAAAWLAEYPLRDGRRRLAIAVVAVVGVVAVGIDGAPAFGSDFGGVIAMVPAFCVLGLMLAGQRVSLLKLGLFCVAGAAVVLLISFVNAQSDNPTHLGRFWQDLMDGDAWDVVLRKFRAMLRSLGYWPFTIGLAGAIGFLYFVLARPGRWRASLLDRAYARSIAMRPALISALTVGVVGTLVNDSGVVILSVTVSLATPLLLAAVVRALELDADEGTERSERPEPRSAPAG
ncbi:hypothetical protein [Spirillospora sp. CA-294931]|uniref:hypothetical protein n=1 Tax=Spirillospora sp. CA-294931 TaxID=3240042 RepID=UPI003D8E1605